MGTDDARHHHSEGRLRERAPDRVLAVITFFALIFLFAASPILVLVDVKQHPIVYRGSSKPAATPVIILGPDLNAPDSTKVQDEPPLPAQEERGDDPQGESPSGEG